MANPFLILGGVVVAVATAAIGVLQVPGWVDSAHDSAANNDLSQVKAAQSAAALTAGGYLSGRELRESADDLKVSVSPSAGVTLCVTRNDDGTKTAAVALSKSGTFFAQVGTPKIGSGETAADALADAGGLPDGVSNPFDGQSCIPDAAVSPAFAAGDGGSEGTDTPDVGAHTDTISYTVKCASTTNFTLPLDGMEGTVTWGDGTTAEADKTSPSRTLTAGTEYTVTFDGTYTGMTAGSPADRSCVRSVNRWDSTADAVDALNAFRNMVNLTDVPAEVPALSRLQGAFEGAISFNDADIAEWDTSQVADMSWVFDGAKSFNAPIGSWDTSSAEDMSYMFRDAAAFNEPLGSWDTSNVTDMTYTFAFALDFNQPLGSWDTSNVTNMSSMFWNTAFDQDISEWAVQNVEYSSGFSLDSPLTVEHSPVFG